MQEVWKRDEIDSPCVKTCVMHPNAKICIGCYRSIDEISGWSAMDASARAALRQELPARADRLVGTRGRARRSRRDKMAKSD